MCHQDAQIKLYPFFLYGTRKYGKSHVLLSSHNLKYLRVLYCNEEERLRPCISSPASMSTWEMLLQIHLIPVLMSPGIIIIVQVLLFLLQVHLTATHAYLVKEIGIKSIASFPLKTHKSNKFSITTTLLKNLMPYVIWSIYRSSCC